MNQTIPAMMAKVNMRFQILMEDLRSVIKTHITVLLLTLSVPSIEEVWIAVMGVTGSGKSSFVQQCTGRLGQEIVGHSLVSCQSTPRVNKSRWNCFDANDTEFW